MYSKGDVLIVNFPFSDLTNVKKRPIVVLAVKGEDVIGCAITSNLEVDGIELNNFAEGNLQFKSKIKYWQIHTFLKEIVYKKVAKINKETYKELTGKINTLFSV